MAKNHGGINADDFAELLFKQMKSAKENVEPYAEDAGRQVGESFADGVEYGLEDASNRISASSVKIGRAFQSLAKKIANQKDIFNISLGGKQVALDIDFSDIDVNAKDFKKRVDQAFSSFKLNNAIEFDSHELEKQFKDMLALYIKYSEKLSLLQNQSTKLTSPSNIKGNAQEQIALINALKEIQKVLNNTAGMSLDLPLTYNGDVKDLRNNIALIEKMEKGEEAIGKRRDTNTKKLKEENKALRERIRLSDQEVKVTGTVKGTSGKFRMKTPVVETEQMSMLPAIEQKDKRKVKSAVKGKTGKFKMSKSEQQIKQLSVDDLISDATEAGIPVIEAGTSAIEQSGAAAEKAAESKKKLADANKKVAATEKDFTNVTRGTKFSNRDYEELYGEMEALAAQRRAENGYDLSKVSVNTDAHGAPVGATISYYKNATKEAIVETFKIDKAAQEAENSIDRLVLTTRKVTVGIADLEKATLGAIKKQDDLIVQKNKTISSMEMTVDPNANRTLFGTEYEAEARKKIQAIRDEVAKLDQTIDGVRVPLPEEELIKIKRRIGELTQEARDYITMSKNAAYAPTQLESHSVSSGNQYRKDQLLAKKERWTQQGIYTGDLEKKTEKLLGNVDGIKDHEVLRKYLEGLKEAKALAELATANKNKEAYEQKKVNEEYQKFINLIKEREELEIKMIGLNEKDNKDELEAVRQRYKQVSSDIVGYMNNPEFASKHTIEEVDESYGEIRKDASIKEGRARDKQRLKEESEAQKIVNEGYKEYIALADEYYRKQLQLESLDTHKDQNLIAVVQKDIDAIEKSMWDKFDGLLSNDVAKAILTLDDFYKNYDKWQKKIAEKQAQNQDKANKPYLNYGKTTANAAERKRDQLQGQYDALDVVNPEVNAQMEAYKEKVQEVINLRNQFANDPNAAKDPALVAQFQKVSFEADQARKNIKAILDEEAKMKQMSDEQGFEPKQLSPDQIFDYKNRMLEMAQATEGGRVEIKGWNADQTKLNYTVTNAKGTVQEMTIALGQGTNTMYRYRTATKETGTAFERFMKGIKTKAKEISTFILGGGSIYKIVGAVRQGIQYVREIDLALTELKKVTDETEETYDKFLDTASKTAAKVGSTIKDVVSSTADWARLGYSMEQAAKFAESTQILMNVSEFTDVSAATDTLISAVQAFEYTADSSMEVVDLLNTIGKIYCRNYIVIYG